MVILSVAGFILRMKRKNRLTINFLCPDRNSKKRRKFRVHKETISLQQPVLDRLNDTYNVPEPGIGFEDVLSQGNEQSSDSETAHTK